MAKITHSERGICSKFITPALKNCKWDDVTQNREEVSFTQGRITVRGELVSLGKAEWANDILFYKPNIPIALIEDKRNTYAIAEGMQQALESAEILKIPFVFSSNGDGPVFHFSTGTGAELETTLHRHEYPTPGELWEWFQSWRRLRSKSITLHAYFEDGNGKTPRNYQVNVNTLRA